VISPNARISIMEGVSARPFDGEWVILDLAGGNYYGLDEVGGAIWRHLAEQQSPREIAARLAPNYDVSEETLLSDVIALVGELLDRGLVRINE
jgi:hypothetical protein